MRTYGVCGRKKTPHLPRSEGCVMCPPRDGHKPVSVRSSELLPQPIQSAQSINIEKEREK